MDTVRKQDPVIRSGQGQFLLSPDSFRALLGDRLPCCHPLAEKRRSRTKRSASGIGVQTYFATTFNDCREPGIKRGLNPAGVL